MKKLRRQRYYAYEARQGGVLWMDKATHEFIKNRPHTVTHFQCKEFTGRDRLMTEEEFKAEREQWRQAQKTGASASASIASPTH